MGRFLAHWFIVPIIPVYQEIIHFNGGCFFAHLFKSIKQAFGDLCLTCGRWPGQGDEYGSPAGGDDFLDALDKYPVDLCIGFLEIPVTKILEIFKLLLTRLETLEWLAAK